MTGNKFELNCNSSGVKAVLFCITTIHNSRASSTKYICDGSFMFVLNAITGYKKDARNGGISEMATIICNYHSKSIQIDAIKKQFLEIRE